VTTHNEYDTDNANQKHSQSITPCILGDMHASFMCSVELHSI